MVVSIVLGISASASRREWMQWGKFWDASKIAEAEEIVFLRDDFGLSLNRDFPRWNTVAQVQNETDQCNVWNTCRNHQWVGELNRAFSWDNIKWKKLLRLARFPSISLTVPCKVFFSLVCQECDWLLRAVNVANVDTTRDKIAPTTKICLFFKTLFWSQMFNMVSLESSTNFEVSCNNTLRDYHV